MTAPVPLNPVDHPAGTRVLCRWSPGVTYEATVGHWSASGHQAFLHGPAFMGHWARLPLVVEVLERPGQERLDRASGSTTGERSLDEETSVQPPPARDPAMVERAESAWHQVARHWKPSQAGLRLGVEVHALMADFASAEVAREGEKFREARSKFWSELQLARSRAEAAEAEVAARDARIAALEQERDEALQLEDLAVASFEQGCQLAARDKEIERWESNQRKLLAEISELKKQSAPSPSGHWTRDPVPEEWHGREFELRNDDRQWRCRLNAGWALALDAHRWSTPIPLPGEERSEACEVERLRVEAERAKVALHNLARDIAAAAGTTRTDSGLILDVANLRTALARARVEAIEEVSAYAITQAKMEEVDGFDGAGESWREIARLCRALLRAEDADDARSHWTYTDGSALGSPPIVSPPEAMLAESARRETEKGDWQWLLRRAALADELAARIREIHKAICDPARARHHEMCMMYELDPEDREEPPK